jgi:DNA repair photolyase
MTTEIMAPEARPSALRQDCSCFVLIVPYARAVSKFSRQIMVRGRGARSNASGRFESQAREAFDDGWTGQDAEPVQLRTTLTAETARTIIAKNDSPDVGFSRSINPYRGCEHGCIYCYARPAHAYMGLSPGLDFESQLFFKPEAARLLEKELSSPRYRPETIHIGGNTDPYQPIERETRITRGVLEVMERFGHPCSIITKSALILRDLDVLARLAARNLVRVAVSVTSLDRRLARSMEPRAATPERRIGAIQALSAAGVPVSVMFAPVIPALNDHELEAVLERAAQAGASGAGYVVLRLPQEIKDLFREWLATDHPDRAARVMSLVRQMRGGADYDFEWRTRMRGEGPIAELLARRFAAARKRFGLEARFGGMDLTQFKVPPKAGDQGDLFDRA